MLWKIISGCGSIYTFWNDLVVRLTKDIPVITYGLITLCTFVYFNDYGVSFKLSDLVGQSFTLIGYQFTHDSFGHLFSNMLFLAILGPVVEKALGAVKFLLFYLICGAVSAVGFGLVNSEITLVGASGAISGIVAMYPFVQERWLNKLYMGIICGVYFWGQMLSTMDDIKYPLIFAGTAHLAHLLGGVAGLILLCLYPKKSQ